MNCVSECRPVSECELFELVLVSECWLVSDSA